jgi:DNA-binding NarL/FixJ family response regulator
VRLVLADDCVLFREGLARLAAESGFEVVAQVGDPVGLVAAVNAHRPDLAVVDIRMPPTSTTEGLEAAQEIRRLHAEVGVLVLSHHVETHHAVRLLGDGAAGVGYLLKDRVDDLAEFADSMRRVGRGERVVDRLLVSQLLRRPRRRGLLDDLTERERTVLALMAEGLSNQGIGGRLGVSERTVEAHVRSTFMKLELPGSHDGHRRVLAVLSYLQGEEPTSQGSGRVFPPRRSEL